MSENLHSTTSTNDEMDTIHMSNDDSDGQTKSLYPNIHSPPQSLSQPSSSTLTLSSAQIPSQSMIMTSSMLSSMSLSGTNRTQQITTTTSSSCQKLEKLRIIKPFDERQLLEFYRNPLLDSNEKFIQHFQERYFSRSTSATNDYYDLIIRLDKSVERFQDIRKNIDEYIEQIHQAEQEKCWNRSEHHLHQSDRCGDGQLVEAQHDYQRYHFDQDYVNNTLDRYHYLLRERLVNEHVVHSYFHKYFQLRFELVIYEADDIIQRLERKITNYNYSNQQPINQNFDSHLSIATVIDDQTSTNCSSSIFDQTEIDVVTQIYQLEPSTRLLHEQLLDLFAALFAYYRRTMANNNNSNEKLKLHCYQAIMHLCRKFLNKLAKYSDRLFLLNQILRCPAGSSSEFSNLLEPLDPLPLKSNGQQFELAKQYVDYGVVTIATILSPIKSCKSEHHSKMITSNNNAGEQDKSNKESLWLMVDNDLDDEEFCLDQSPSPIAELTENDIICYLSRVPFREMLHFMSLITDDNDGQNFENNEDNDTINSSTETSMIRLFAFSTRLIQIFRHGLQNFNCLRFKRLTLYLASMIKQIIKTISDNWRWCKEKFTTKDQALLIRLQVEFDHFMLRSITAILSTNRRGVWPLLAKIDFEGISEPMLWNILWVVYQNGRNEQNEIASGLCPYMSSNYWKDKFRSHVHWKFVFIEKLAILSLEEASGLLDFFYNMAISRSKFESLMELSSSSTTTMFNDLSFDNIQHVDDFLREIIERFAEICLLRKLYSYPLDFENQMSQINPNQYLILNNQEFYSTKGVACLIKLLTRYKSMLFVLLQFLQSINDESNLLIQPCLDLFTSIVINDWKPEIRLFSLLYKWLTERPYDHVHNRFARILLTKIGWNRILVQNDKCLMIPIQQQQQFALKLYQAMEQHFKSINLADAINSNNNDTKTKIMIEYPIIQNEHLSSEEHRLRIAQSHNPNDYGCWCWSMLLSLRLHPLDLIPDESCWDDIIYGSEHKNKYSSSRRKHWTMQYMMKFNYDSEMIQIARGIEMDNPYAIYIAAMMSDLLFNAGHSSIDLKRMTELNDQLIRGGHLIPMLHILYHFLPFCFENDGELRANSSFILSILTLLQNDMTAEQLSSIILLQRKHFSRTEYSQQTCQAWTECLFETMNRCLNMKTSSWLSSFMPQFLQSSSSTLNVIDMILGKITIIFDQLSMELLLENGDCLKLYQQYLCRKLYGRMMNWKLTQLDSVSGLSSAGNSGSGVLSSSSSPASWLSLYWYSNEVNVPAYLPDKTLIRSPWMTPFHLLLRHCLNSKQSIRIRQPVYLIFLLTEIDIRRTFNIWNYLVFELRKTQWNSNETQIDYMMIETVLTQACTMYEKAPLPCQLLPLNLLTVYLLKLIPTADSQSSSDRHPHPMIPLLWRQFFSNYFLYTDSLSTIGNRFIDTTRLKQLNDRLNSLFDYHNQRWIRLNNERPTNDSISIDSELVQNELQQQQQSDSISALLFEDRLVKLYRAYRIWLKDNRFLQYADLDDEQFAKPEIQIKLLNSVVSVSCGRQIIVGHNYHFIQENFWPEFDHLNTFFMLNYVHKIPLQSYILLHEQSWIRLVKPILESLKHFNDDFDDNDNGDDNDNNNIDRKLLKLPESSSNEIQFIDTAASRQSIRQSVEYNQSDRFGQIIEYFTKLTASLNCNILFLDSDIGYNLGYVLDDNNQFTVDFDGQKSEQDISIVFVIIHQIVDNIVEEARFVENQLEKFNTLNVEFCKDILPKLYHDVSRDLIQRISCDRSEFDPSGCTKPAAIKFEFIESLLNNYIKQKLDRNRAEMDTIITSLIEDVPGQKVVASIYFMQKIANYLLRFYIDGSYPQRSENNNQQQRIQRLFETMSGWINSINLIGIKYHLTGQLLDIFLDMLQKLSTNYVDEINHFYLNTALQRSVSMSLTQQLAPCLTPSKTSPKMFIQMYKLIGSRLNQQHQQQQQQHLTSPPQSIFVLLSKFDVATWLQLSHLKDEQRLDLLECLFQCFTFFGPNPSDDYLVIYDLYRKHLQDMILYRFPIFMTNILAYMLQGMNEQQLAPTLWNSILHTFGFYTKSLSSFSSLTKYTRPKLNENSSYIDDCERELSIIDFDYQTFDDDLRMYVMRQKLFTSHELYNLLKLMLEFKHNLHNPQHQQQQQPEFLDHFKIYNVKFLQFLTFISYCWINSNATTLPDDISIIWLPFFENWRSWIFPRHNTKFIQWEHFCFAWQLFIISVQFMLDSFYGKYF